MDSLWESTMLCSEVGPRPSSATLSEASTSRKEGYSDCLLVCTHCHSSQISESVPNDYDKQVLWRNRRIPPEAPTDLHEIGQYEGTISPPRQRSATRRTTDHAEVKRTELRDPPHPVYSPDLAPTDNYFHRHLDNFLRDICFKNKDTTKSTFNHFVAYREKDFYLFSINKLISSLQTCVDCVGSYFEYYSFFKRNYVCLQVMNKTERPFFISQYISGRKRRSSYSINLRPKYLPVWTNLTHLISGKLFEILAT